MWARRVSTRLNSLPVFGALCIRSVDGGFKVRRRGGDQRVPVGSENKRLAVRRCHRVDQVVDGLGHLRCWQTIIAPIRDGKPVNSGPLRYSSTGALSINALAGDVLNLGLKQFEKFIDLLRIAAVDGEKS
jgi:hypothetical protein